MDICATLQHGTVICLVQRGTNLILRATIVVIITVIIVISTAVRFRIFENEILRRIFGSEGLRDEMLQKTEY
jgi:hypothetical protein